MTSYAVSYRQADCLNPVPHKQVMADLADQVLTAASKHDIKTANAVFVLTDSELPKTVARAIDLSRFKKDCIDREMESVISDKTRIHRFQCMIKTKVGYQALLKSKEFNDVLDMSALGQRIWVEGMQVPAQIYSPIMWIDIATYFSGDEVKWIDTLAVRDITGGGSKRLCHADRWTRVAK